MELQLIRTSSDNNYTEGKLYIDNVYFCDTLENKDRGLDLSMSILEISKRKIYGETCIPSGKYKVVLYLSPKFKKVLPLILGVKGFIGILIHAGNTTKDTEGCVLVGTKLSDGVLKNSNITVDALLNKLQSEKYITININYSNKLK